jgi:hypothetical protein
MGTEVLPTSSSTKIYSKLVHYCDLPNLSSLNDSNHAGPQSLSLSLVHVQDQPESESKEKTT